MEILKRDQTKLMLVMAYAGGDPGKLGDILAFVSLEMRDFTKVLDFKSNDWMAYGAAREWEWFCNRAEDDKREGRQMLTRPQFAKYNGDSISERLTYELYTKMTKAEEAHRQR